MGDSDTSDNMGDSDTSDATTSSSVYMALIMTLIMTTLPGLIANSLALYCILPDIKKKSTVVKLLMLSLVITDMCGCIGVMFYQMSKALADDAYNLCAAMSFFTVYFPLLSGTIATFMSAERCMALRAPYWYHANMNTWKFWTPFAIAIVIVTVICILPYFGLGRIVGTVTNNNVTTIICQTLRLAGEVTQLEPVFSLTYGVTGLLLVALNLGFNGIVIRTVGNMRKIVVPSTGAPDMKSVEFEITKMVFALSATFLICWTPFNLNTIMFNLGVEYIRTFDIMCHMLIGLNFAIDPLIYLLLKTKYRQKMRQLLCCCVSLKRYNPPQSGAKKPREADINIITPQTTESDDKATLAKVNTMSASDSSTVLASDRTATAAYGDNAVLAFDNTTSTNDDNTVLALDNRTLTNDDNMALASKRNTTAAYCGDMTFESESRTPAYYDNTAFASDKNESTAYDGDTTLASNRNASVAYDNMVIASNNGAPTYDDYTKSVSDNAASISCSNMVLALDCTQKPTYDTT